MRNLLLGFASLLLAAPAAAQAPTSGTITIVIEGSFGVDLGAPTPPPPPVVVVEPAPATPPAPAPAPTTAMPTAPSSYQLSAGAVLRPAPVAEPTLAPVYVPDSPTAPPAAPERPRYRRRVGLMVGGAVMFAGAWGLNIGGTLLAMTLPFYNEHRDDLFFSSLIPVVGPLVQIGFRDDDWQIPFFVGASALQVAGLVMAIVGTVSRVRVEDEETPVTVVPYASGDGAGVNLLGSF